MKKKPPSYAHRAEPLRAVILSLAFSVGLFSVFFNRAYGNQRIAVAEAQLGLRQRPIWSRHIAIFEQHQCRNTTDVELWVAFARSRQC